MKYALRAEWTKLRTNVSTGWLLLAMTALTTALSAAAAAAVNYTPAGSSQDTTRLSLTGIQLGQAVTAVLAVLAMSNEYSTGMIHLTLAAMPRRSVVLAAKAAILSALTLAAGAIAILGSLLAGRFILSGEGFTPAHGYALLSLAHGPTVRAAIGSDLYLTLITLISLGAASALRDAATAISAVLGLLYVVPLVGHVVTSPAWQQHIQQVAPMTAGLAIQATADLPALPVSPWDGLGVLAIWAATALLAGGFLLQWRDA
jgi:ABC-2 type transport system permease protein